MSLKEKLSQKSQELEEAKLAEESGQKEKELEPIRAKIKDLESEKYQLDLVKGSLELKSGSDTGKGMKEYASDTEQEIKKETTTLDTLMDEHKDVLETAGIENRDQLAENPEFAEEPEVVNYKQAVEKSEDLSVADGSLQKKLEELGVSVDSEHFSYEEAEKAIAEKLQTVETELIKEKIQTPEGREEAIEMLATQLEDTLPKGSLSKDKENYKFSLKGKGRENHFDRNIVISKDTAKLEGSSSYKLVPEEVKKIEELYGEEIAQEALKKAYANTAEKAVDEFDKNGENVSALMEQMQSIKPEEAEKARKLRDEFTMVQNEFRTVMQQKAEELKEKGIRFSTTHVSGYGGNYEEYISLARDENENKEINKTLNLSGDFPPKYDFVKLQEYIQKRKSAVEEFTQAIKEVETKEQAENVSETHDKSLVSKLHHKLMNAERDNIRFSFNTGGYVTESSKLADMLLKEGKSYSGVMDLLEGKAKKLDAIEEQVLNTLDKGIEKEVLEQKLATEIKTEKFGSDINNIEFKINQIEQDKNSALELMSKLVPIESQIPDDEAVDFSNNEFRVRSVDNQLQELKKSREQKQDELRSKTYELEQKKSKKPGLFGSTSKWEKEIETLEQDKKDLETSVSKMGNEEYRNLYDKYSFPVRFSTSYSGAAGLLKDEYIQGTKQEVFNTIREKLTEIINRKAPDSVVKLYEQYKESKK